MITVLWIVFACAALYLALTFGHLAYTAWVRKRFPATGVHVDAAGVQMHIVRRGAGPTVVLIHGANGTLSDFPDALIDDLARDHDVIAIDRPGHGWSDPGSGPLDLQANARAVLATLRACGVARAVLLGHSYGAAVALRAALDEASMVAGVVAVTPCTIVDFHNARFTRVPLPRGLAAEALFHLFTLPLAVPSSPSMRRHAWHPDPPPRGEFASRAFSMTPGQARYASENFRHLQADFAVLARDLPSLMPPFVVLAGAEDRITPAGPHTDWLATAVPGTGVEVLQGVGHWLPRLRADAVAEAVRSLGPAERRRVPRA